MVTKLTHILQPALSERRITLINLSGFVQSRIMTIVVISGAPGIGKTTTVINAARTLKDRRLNVGGIVSRELRINNTRVGFEFIDLITNNTSVLASTTGRGPKVGKYFVSLEGCRFAAERLTDTNKSCDVIICDEIGPMELKSMDFINSLKNLLDVDKKIIVVVHQKLHHPLADQFRNKSSLLINIDLENREKVSEMLIHRIIP